MTPEEFLSTLFEGLEGHLCLIETNGKGNWNAQRFYSLPDQYEDALGDVQWSLDRSLGYSPFLYEEPARQGDVPGVTRVIGLDADHVGPEKFKAEPSIIIETSPNSYHLLWLLDDTTSKDEAVAVGRAMRDAHGLEASATNLSKVLRFPGSLNVDSSKVIGGEPFTVTARSTGAIYALDELSTLYPPKTITGDVTSVSLGDLPTNLPSLFEVESKVFASDRLDQLLSWREIDQVGAEKDKRSERIHELCHLLLEQGLTPEEALVLGWTADPVREHYADKGRSIEEFWRYDLAKVARLRGIGADLSFSSGEVEPAAQKTITTTNLLSPAERQFVRDNPSWIDWWVDQCYRRLDSRTPRDYLVAFGYMLLACTLSSAGSGVVNDERLDTNLYMLNLGPTGTGKTESLKFWKRCLSEFEEMGGYDVAIGSDATPEGLIKALRDYDDRMAVLTRDEVSGMFAEWIAKGYHSGATETYLDLYSNWVPVTLRAGKDAGSPHRTKLHAFNVYFTGTPEKVFRILTKEFYETGFMQRLIPILGERGEVTEEDYKAAKRQGDPTRFKEMDELPRVIAAELYDIAVSASERRLVWFSDEAWQRWVDFGWTMQESLEYNPESELLKAVAERLATSVQKMAVLLALQDRAESVELRHLLPVIEHAETWLRNVVIISAEIAESEHSRRVDEAVMFLKANHGKVPLEKFYNQFKALRARDADEILVSMASQGLARQADDDRRKKWLLLAGVTLDSEKRK